MAIGRAVGVDGHEDAMAEKVLPWREAAVVRRLRSGLDPRRRSGRALRTLSGGLADHATLRMLAIDEAVSAATDAGVRQVVVLGAGLDTRAWRLPALADCRVYELELPRAQADKRRRLGGISSLARDVVFVPADLDRVDLDWALGHAGHDPREATVWIAEGVVMYLHPEAIAAMLTDLGRRSAPGSVLAMTYAGPDLLGDSRVGRHLEPLARGLFSALGEPLTSLHTDEEARLLLHGTGFDDVEVTTSADWAHAAGRVPTPDAFASERLAVARRQPPSRV